MAIVGVKGRQCHYVKETVCPGGMCEKCAKWMEFEAGYLERKLADVH